MKVEIFPPSTFSSNTNSCRAKHDTPLKINMEPKNHPIKKENHLRNLFLGLNILNFGAGTHQSRAFPRAMAMFQSRVGLVPQGKINNSKVPNHFWVVISSPPSKPQRIRFLPFFFFLVLSEPKKHISVRNLWVNLCRWLNNISNEISHEDRDIDPVFINAMDLESLRIRAQEKPLSARAI